jgi:4'-phosphopantetheinyl transferase EntD
MPDPAHFLSALGGTLPPGVALGSDDPRRAPAGLMPGEWLEDPVPSRLAEFAAGRRAARAAMARLGHAQSAIPHQKSRAPLWPTGLVGSISHCVDLCVTVVGQAAHWSGLGVDLERDHGLDPALWSEVLRPEELAALGGLSAGDQPDAALRTFVIKEAVYKAQYATSRTLFGFDTLSIRVTDTAFAATFMDPVPGFPLGHRLTGQWVRAGGYVAAWCAISKP